MNEIIWFLFKNQPNRGGQEFSNNYTNTSNNTRQKCSFREIFSIELCRDS